MTQQFQLKRLIIYPHSAQAYDEVNFNVGNTHNGTLSQRLPPGLITSTLYIVTSNGESPHFTLQPAATGNSPLPQSQVEVIQDDNSIYGIFINQDRHSITLQVDDKYMRIWQPTRMMSQSPLELYPYISVRGLTTTLTIPNSSLHFNYMLSSLRWQNNYLVIISPKKLYLQERAQIINQSADTFSADQILLYGGTAVTPPTGQFLADSQGRELVQAQATDSPPIDISKEDVIKVMEFSGHIPPGQMFMNTGNSSSAQYQKYYRHPLGSQGATVIYRFEVPIRLATGRVDIYSGGTYLGTSRLNETELGQNIDLETGKVNLPLISTIRVVRKHPYYIPDNSPVPSASDPSTVPTGPTSSDDESLPGDKNQVPDPTSTSPSLAGLSSTADVQSTAVDKSSSTRANNQTVDENFEVDEVRAQLDFTNPRSSNIQVLLIYTTQHKVLEIDPLPNSHKGSTIEWIVNFQQRPDPQRVEILMYLLVPKIRQE